MQRFFYIGIHAAFVSAVLIPIFFLFQKRIRNGKRTALYCVLAIYLSAVFAVAGLPTVGYIRFDPNINLKPFAYMFSDFTNSFLNVVLFVPLGILLPLLWHRFQNPLRILCFGLMFSVGIEILQLFTSRATDINDLITNTLGALIGWVFGRIAVCFLHIPVESGNKRDVCLIIFLAFGVMFFLQPVIEMLTWRLFV